MLEQHTLVDGDSNCSHNYVMYTNDKEKRLQYWECDNPGCRRKIMVYSRTHLIIKFQPRAFIRSHRKQRNIYRYRADEKGIARGELEPKDRVRKRDLIL